MVELNRSLVTSTVDEFIHEHGNIELNLFISSISLEFLHKSSFCFNRISRDARRLNGEQSWELDNMEQ
jgi:hypothetical protein